MKWHKFMVDFWSSETAHLLEVEFGARGTVVYLQIQSTIAKDIGSLRDVSYAHKKGWGKSLGKWAAACKSSPRFVKKVLQFLHENGKLEATLFESEFTVSELRVNSQFTDWSKVSSLTWINLKFRNFGEFVHKDALSSKSRRNERIDPPEKLEELAGQIDDSGPAIDKKQTQHQTTAGVGPPRGGDPASEPSSDKANIQNADFHTEVDSNGWKKSEREIRIEDFAKRASVRNSASEFYDNPFLLDPPLTIEDRKAEARRLAEIAKIPREERGSNGFLTDPSTAQRGELKLDE